MTQSKNRLTAMTAIAAVLALATPAIAQDAQPAPVTTAPETSGVTPPTVEPAPSTAPAPSTTTPADPLSATTPVEAEPVPVPATAAAARARTTPRRATATSSAPVRSVTRVRATPSTMPRTTVAASATPTSPAPIETLAPLAAPIVAATPVAALPAAVETPALPVESASNDVLPIAAGGLGLLALLGAGVALRRRKRREEEVEYEAFDEPTFEEQRAPVAFAEPMREPSMTHAPVMAAPVAAAAAANPLDTPATSVPEGFDLSRFGEHVQAAYSGPTEDNPSLSLKNRLRRASAMDQMARNNDEPAQPAAPQPLAAATSTLDTGAVVSKMRPAPTTSSSFILGGDTKRPALHPVTQH